MGRTINFLEFVLKRILDIKNVQQLEIDILSVNRNQYMIQLIQFKIQCFTT